LTTVAEQIVTAVHPADQLDAGLIDEWRQLEARSRLGNACLSPEFLVPAMRHLEPDARPWVARAELGEGHGRLVGIATFTRSGPTAKIPFPHLRLFETKHTYINGFLLDQEHAAAALEALLQAVFAHQGWRLGLYVNLLQTESDCYRLLTAQEVPFHWEEFINLPRAIVKPVPDFVEKHLPSRLKADLRRKWKRLGELGKPEWRFVHSNPEIAGALENLLHLENMGWKGEGGSSLLSSSAEAQFFRELTAGFAQRDKVFILELCLDGVAISSQSVFLSGNGAFLFKLGWNPEYRPFGPGALNAVELAQRLQEMGKELVVLDSCATTGSWFERYWRESYSLVSGFIVPRGLGSGAVSSLKALYKLKRKLVERWQRDSEED